MVEQAVCSDAPILTGTCPAASPTPGDDCTVPSATVCPYSTDFCDWTCQCQPRDRPTPGWICGPRMCEGPLPPPDLASTSD